MNNRGFTLIEVLVFLIVASIIMASLMQFINQTNAYQKSIFNKSSVSIRAQVLFHHFEKDVLGIFVPIQNSIQEETQKEPIGGKKNETLNDAIAKTDTANINMAEKKSDAEKKIQHILFSKEEVAQTALVSFVTHSALKVYWSTSVGRAKPAVVRVTYTLQKDMINPDSFIMHRQESPDLSFDQTNKNGPHAAKKYDIIEGIKNFSVEFIVVEYEDQSKKNSDATSSRVDAKKTESKSDSKNLTPKITRYTTWDWPADEKNKDDKNATEKPFPRYISVKLSLWDEYYEKVTDFVYTIPCICTLELGKKNPTEKKQYKNNISNEPIKAEKKQPEQQNASDNKIDLSKNNANKSNKRTMLTQKTDMKKKFPEVTK